jgi:hypothetical protein
VPRRVPPFNYCVIVFCANAVTLLHYNHNGGHNTVRDAAQSGQTMRAASRFFVAGIISPSAPNGQTVGEFPPCVRAIFAARITRENVDSHHAIAL